MSASAKDEEAYDETPKHMRRCFSLADVLEDELAGKIRYRDPAAKPEADESARLKALNLKLREADRSALCLSGGGIRSATFGLGVLQVLARRGLLPKFDYLSTVSGGGYIGGWLSAWIHNQDGNVHAVMRGLDKEAKKPSDAEAEAASDATGEGKSNIESDRDSESAPIRHLRRYSNYLTPKLGFFSSDTWTVIATVLRNIFLNWLMLIPIIAAVLMLPRLYASLAFCWSTPLWGTITILAASLLCMLMATTYSALDLPTWQARGGSEKARSGKLTRGGFGRFCLAGLLFSALLASIGWFWLVGTFPARAAYFKRWDTFPGAWTFALLLGGASALGGFIALLWLRQFSFKVMLREGLPVWVTALFGGAALWWVLTWLFADLVPYEFDAVALNFLCFAPSLVLVVFLLMNFLYVVTFSRRTTPEDREWWSRSAGWILITALAWAVASAIVLWGPIGLHMLRNNTKWVSALITAFGGTAGVVTALIGYSTRTKAKKKEDAEGRSWLPVGAVAFLLFLLVYLAIFSSWLLAKLIGTATDMPPGGADYRAFYSTSVVQASLLWTFVLFLIFLTIGWGLGFLVNVNQFSLHAMYNSRLTRAFLGASRSAAKPRKPHWFTGFDADDRIEMHELKNNQTGKLFHIINIAMNVVGGKELAWQERMAQSFTVSRLHSGSWLTGYRASKLYDGGISLGTAMTISGAAANPNMGYHSSPLVTILMTLFNVRLGWWAGNPGPAGDKTWSAKGPRHAALPLLSEAFGNTTSDFRDVNLSDGGHFENLGLYEMVLRRCRRIVVVDAGRDTGYVFEDLGNAIRKIRVDFGIPIEIVVTLLEPDKERMHLARCAVGRIRYAKVDPAGPDGTPAPDGVLIYIKPLLRKTEPVDVRNYAAAHREFPHETTNDQWFSESQLESYRMLGQHTMEDIFGRESEQKTWDIESFFAHAKKQVEDIEKASTKASGSVPTVQV